MAMNQSEVERMLRRHDNDISDMYPLLGQVQTTLGRHTKRFDEVDARFDAMDARFDGMDARFDAMDARFDGIDTRIEGIETKVDEILTLLRPGS